MTPQTNTELVEAAKEAPWYFNISKLYPHVWLVRGLGSICLNCGAPDAWKTPPYCKAAISKAEKELQP